MRCRRCQRTISGIGKPAVPPVIPALLAFAGVLGGLWSLTLGQDPSNALPHWSPASGWGLGLGSLALASVLGWIGLVRRKCSDCGSSQMLDAMEEESVIASERLGAQRAAVEEARAEWRSSRDREMADSLEAREQELRATLEQELRARLVRELEPQVARDLRGRLEKELRITLGNELRQRVEQEQRIATAARPPTSPSAPGASGPRTLGPATVTPTPVRPFSSPQARVETAPLAMRPSPGKDRGGKP